MTAIDLKATHTILPFAIISRFLKGIFADDEHYLPYEKRVSSRRLAVHKSISKVKTNLFELTTCPVLSSYGLMISEIFHTKLTL